MTSTTRRLVRAALLGGIALPAAPALAQSQPQSLPAPVAAPASQSAASPATNPAVTDSDVASLLAAVRAQAERIRQLEARLSVLEGPLRNTLPQRAARRDEEAAALYPAPLRRAPDSDPLHPAPADPLASLPAATVAASEAITPIKPLDLNVIWGDGAPILAKSDGSFTFKPRGRLLMDFDATSGSRLRSRNVVTTGLRAARLGVEGTFFSHGFYQFEIDFAENQTELVAAFLGYQARAGDIEYDVRIGNMFNDRSLEGQTGSLSTPFIERNFVANAILPQKSFYGMGGMARAFGKNWHASVSVTGDPVDGEYDASDTLGVASRVHWNPVKNDTAAVHLGAWGFWENLSDDARTITRNTTVGARFDSALRISTGPLTDADHSLGYGLELAGLYDNFYAWAEYGRRDLGFLPGAPTADFSTDAWSISGGVFLTGERSPYSSRQGNFLNPKIRKSVGEGGPGAFEILGRYERLDYTRTPLGGSGREATLGLNWYPMPLVRFMINWSRWHVDNRVEPLIGKDDGNSITTRAQFNF